MKSGLQRGILIEDLKIPPLRLRQRYSLYLKGELKMKIISLRL
jgi:hypothetical protein